MGNILDPTADALIKKIELDKGKKIKKLKPGQKPPLGALCVFTYDAKWKKKLEYWDAFPASICLAHYSNGFLGIAVHYLEWSKRLSLANELMKSRKNKKRIRYGNIKSAIKKLKLPVGYSYFILKRYLYGHITSPNVYVFEWEDYHEFLKDIPPKFQKKSDKFAFAATRKMWSDHVKNTKKTTADAKVIHSKGKKTKDYKKK